MKKYIKILLLVLTFVGCQNKEQTTTIDKAIIPANDGHRMVVTNLDTDDTEGNVTALMGAYGIEEERLERFKTQVDFFNSNIDNSLLLGEFTKTNDIVEYDVYAMQDQMFEKFPSFPGINCRITTFGLIENYIKMADGNEKSNDAIMIDQQAFIDPPVPTLDPEEIKKFEDFYQVIKLDKDSTRSEDADVIADFFAKRLAITTDTLSLISVYVYSDLDPEAKEVFVGHTGVLFTLEDGRLMLVEKLAFTAPYQAVTFENRKDLHNYLMAMYDTSSPEYPNKPLIFENDKLIVY